MQLRYHAVVFDGEREEGLSRARTYVEQVVGVTVEQNPDVTVEEHQTYGINNARVLKARASQAPLGKEQVFILGMDAITNEAQNALLKLLEEPVAHTCFVLVLPSLHQLLPTVRSRVAYGGRANKPLEKSPQARAFQQGNPAARLAIIEPMVKNKDRRAAQTLLNALETALYKEGVQKNAMLLSELTSVRLYITDRSSSLKMILEHLIAVLPQT